MPLVVILQCLWWFENSLIFGEEEKGSATEAVLILTF